MNTRIGKNARIVNIARNVFRIGFISQVNTGT